MKRIHLLPCRKPASGGLHKLPYCPGKAALETSLYGDFPLTYTKSKPEGYLPWGRTPEPAQPRDTEVCTSLNLSYESPNGSDTRVLAAAEGASPVTVLPGPWLLWIRVSPMVTFSPGQWRQDGNSHPLGLHRVVTRSAHTDPDTEVCSSLIPSYDSFYRAKEFQ